MTLGDASQKMLRRISYRACAVSPGQAAGRTGAASANVPIKAFILFASICLSLTAGVALASPDSENQAAAQANNPLADIRALNLQNYYVGAFNGVPNGSGNQFVLRYAQPLQIGASNWLIRASLPMNSLPVGPGFSTVSGIGDLDIFAAYQFDTGNPATSFAIGPQIVAPTGKNGLGADQWQLGLANVYFNAISPLVQYGYLLTYRGGVGDTNGKPRASVAAFQPFVFYQLGKGWYSGGAPIWSYNFENDNYAVPLGLRLGKVTRQDKTIFNVFVEPQYSVARRGAGVPEWQIYLALNMQFLK